MKKILILTTFFSSLIITSVALANWTKMERGFRGDVYYVDLNKIKKHEELAYYWRLVDYRKPDPDGFFSNKSYMEVNCKQLGERHLLVMYYSLPMAEGILAKTLKWKNSSLSSFNAVDAGSVREEMVTKVCNHKP